MIAVIQRVSRASVTIDGGIAGQIPAGLCVLASIHHDDTPADISWLAAKLVTMRIFPNEGKEYDRDVKESGGGILLVSNFTVAADTRTGRRPSLNPAAAPEIGRALFDDFVSAVRKEIGAPERVATGVFGADMQVEIINDGPTTFLLDSRAARAR